MLYPYNTEIGFSAFNLQNKDWARLGLAYEDGGAASVVDILNAPFVRVPLIQNLSKAVTIGIDDASRQALMFEQLDDRVSTLTFSDKQLRLFKLFNLLPAWNHQFDYVRMKSRGSVNYMAMSETGTPTLDTSQFQKCFEILKVFGQKREVSIPSYAVKITGTKKNIAAWEETNQMLQLMKGCEQTHFWHGINTDVDGNVCDYLNVNGIIRQIIKYANEVDTDWWTANRFDCKNGDLTIDHLIKAGVSLEEYGWMPDISDAVFISSPGVKGALHSQEATYRKYMVKTEAFDHYGLPAESMDLNQGSLPFVSSVFMKAPYVAKSVADVGAPTRPTSVTAAETTPAIRSFWSSAEAGMDYAVSAYLHGLESEVRELAGVQSVGIGKGITLTITPAAAVAYSGFRIYKRYSATDKWRWVTDIACPVAGDAEYEDNNLFTGRQSAFILPRGKTETDGEMANDIEIRQLLPFLKIYAAITQLTIPWFLFTVMNIVVRNPRRVIWFADIKD